MGKIEVDTSLAVRMPSSTLQGSDNPVQAWFAPVKITRI
jgi:hypothetical protein